MSKYKTSMSRDEALTLLKKYNKEDFHIKHATTLEAVMRFFAEKLGYEDESDFWAMVGLLHDLDFEMYPDEHCVKVVDLLKGNGAENQLISSIISHGYGMTASDVKPDHQMEKILYAVDELTGLIGAAALMRPSKSVQDMELKSLKKKFKDKKFAAGCSRDTIKTGADILGWDLDRLFTETLEAMKQIELNPLA